MYTAGLYGERKFMEFMEYKNNQKREILLKLVGTFNDLIEILGCDEEDKKIIQETYNEIDDLPEKDIEEIWDSGVKTITQTINQFAAASSAICACVVLRKSFRAVEKEIGKRFGDDSKKGQA